MRNEAGQLAARYASSRAWSRTTSSVSRTEPRSRASKATTGTSSATARAHRISAEVVGQLPVEGVHRDHERQPGLLEVVDGRVAVVEPAAVHDDERAERASTRSSHMKPNRFWPGVPNR